MKQARVGMTLDEFKRAALESIRGNARAEHAIWYLNIKKFRFINESYGYEFGDLILKEFENYLVQRISSRGICANLGDDRFVVCVSQGSYESDAASAAFEELYREMNLLLASHGLEQAVDIAAGVYFLTPEDVEARDIDYLIDQANAAHRRAREQGGSHVIFFDYAYAEKIRRANMIEVDLGNAIAAGEIEVWMQPLLDFVKGEVVAAEALARWNHAKLGRISPAEFIPVLESAGKIGQLDRYIWNVACYEAYNRHVETGEDIIPFSVNVSRAEILDPTLPTYLENLRERYSLPAHVLRLEVTESAYTDQPEELIRVVTDLRNRGFIVEMDDFGSGYSSLNMLRNLPVDILKLDMGFLRNENSSEHDAVILNSVIRMAHGLDIPVIAEGVETIEQAEMLKAMGCRLMQGYFFAKPMPIEQFYKLLKDTENAHHEYVPIMHDDKVARLLDQRSDTAFFFNNCVGPAFIFITSDDRYEVMLANDELYDELALDQHTTNLFRANLLQLMDIDGREGFRRATRHAMQHQSARCSVRFNEHGIWADCSIRLISPSDSGDVMVCYVQDATEAHELERSLAPSDDADYAVRDELTGLMTYHALDELVGGELGKNGGTLMLVDIDDFSTLSDVDEKRIVDSLVDHVADTVRMTLPKDALLARCGEGLFAAFLPSAHDDTDVRASACKVIDAIRTSKDERGEKVTCSLGLAYTVAGTSLRMGIVYRRALRALTIAKINGGDGFLLYETVRAEAGNDIGVFGVELRHAIDGELLPASALEGEGLFNVISRDFEQHHTWNASQKQKRSVRDAVFGALRYRSMAELPGILSFDYDALEDVIYLESVTHDGQVDQRAISNFHTSLFDYGKNIASESMARLSTLLSDLEYLPSAGNVDLKCRLDADADFRWYRFSFTSLRNEKSFVIRGLGYGEDIDLSRESGLWWKDRAMHDGLTGLLNREGLEDAIESQLARTNCGMMFIVDVDEFKCINENFGHLAGDSVLCELADTLLAMFRDHDVVGRYGSDEMIAFIAGLTSRELAQTRARAVAEMASQIHVGDQGSISVSVGVGILEGSPTFYDYLELADHAVHVSKANGAGGFSIADGSNDDVEIHQISDATRTRRTKEGIEAMRTEARFNRDREAQGNA